MIFGSVCSGIEAASVAWYPLGWRAAWLAEIEPFPSAVLAHRWPDVPNRGDFTRIHADVEPGSIDLLVGGTPCQSFSVAGLRGGLDDPRGNLALEFLRLAEAARPEWVVWENVPGVLSSNGGRDFGAFVGGLGQLGYGWAYRVLDAQHFGVPQRRRRVFVVGHLGDWRRAVAVLFERDGLSGHPPPGREAGQGVAGSLTGSLGRRNGQPDGGDTNGHLIAGTLTSRYGAQCGRDFERADMTIAHTLRADGFDASEDGTGRGTPLVPVAFQERGREGGRSLEWQEGQSYALTAPNGGGRRHEMNVAVPIGQCILSNQGSGGNRSWCGMDEPHATLIRESGPNAIIGPMAVRRLTPRECERLQGFPDDYTLIPVKPVPAKSQARSRERWEAGDERFADIDGVIHFQSADGPRYKALGNSMAVPVMRWIGERIAAVKAAARPARAAGPMRDHLQ